MNYVMAIIWFICSAIWLVSAIHRYGGEDAAVERALIISFVSLLLMLTYCDKIDAKKTIQATFEDQSTVIEDMTIQDLMFGVAKQRALEAIQAVEEQDRDSE